MFKKINRQAQVRHRKEENSNESSSNSESSDDQTKVIEKRRRPGLGGITAQSNCTSTNLKRKHAQSSSDDDQSDGETEMRRRLLLGESLYTSNKTAKTSGPSDHFATALNEIETKKGSEFDKQTQYEEREKIIEEKKANPLDKTYRGMHTYDIYNPVRESVINNAKNAAFLKKGPVRQSEFVRQSIRYDYAMGICKDWKETGYCGFGSNCKFMHDRTDYKTGWELEREWKEGRYQQAEENYELTDSDDEELPFKCFICRQSFDRPVVTKCKHYFCEKCALDHYKERSQKCAACGQQTFGVFNPAKDIIARMGGQMTKKEKRKDMKRQEKEEKCWDNTGPDVKVETKSDDDNEQDHYHTCCIDHEHEKPKQEYEDIKMENLNENDIKESVEEDTDQNPDDDDNDTSDPNKRPGVYAGAPDRKTHECGRFCRLGHKYATAGLKHSY